MSPTATRLGVRTFTVSVAINAVLGIVALLGGAFGELQGRMLASSVLVSAAMGSVLVNAPAIRRRVVWPVPLFGAIGGAGGFAALLLLVWLGDAAFALVGMAESGLVIGAAATLVAALRLVGPWPGSRWLPAPTNAAIVALATTILAVIWTDGAGGSWAARVIGVESVLVAAGTLLIPVRARFAPEVAGDPTAESPVTCPHCGETFERSAELR